LLTRTISGRDAIEKSLISVSSIISDLLGEKCINNITNTVSDDITQNMIYLNHMSENSVDSQINNIILSSALRAENTSSGSCSVYFSTINYFLKKLKYKNTNKLRLSFLKEAKQSIIETSLEMSRFCYLVSDNDFKKLILEVTHIPEINEILNKLAFDFSPMSEIVVEKSNLYKSYLNETSGNIVNIEIPQICMTHDGRWDRTNIDCILVDGYIESASQIHHFLTSTSEKGASSIIVCRSASEDVKNTIFHNFNRGTLDLVIVETGYDVEYHHMLSDISKLFNCNIINIDMGDTISGGLKDKIFKIERAILTHKNMTIFSNLSLDNVSKYISDLRYLKNTLDMNDLESYNNLVKSIDLRIKFLNSKRYEIKIGKRDIDLDPLVISRIDKFLRSFPDMSNSGIVKVENALSKSDLTSKIYCICNKKIFTQKQIATGFIIAYKTLETLIKAEKVLTIDR